MIKAGGNKFLVDGFPRNKENLDNWEKILGATHEGLFVLHLKCSEVKI
jgi:UMP-CMP kinase